ncbi:uncharacterized protein LOC131064423 isoform X2 [Cryptomeria japonica]|uniref:uncharacterized protein LOC131064423 isoform X2 n=1 Tax=Cryptomeria japonica TaxID=3369 RepID=UPI0027DA17BB|nr:uncharacterized protein LOC131064423 isoform X2 [Cryptomeria japonica]
MLLEKTSLISLQLPKYCFHLHQSQKHLAVFLVAQYARYDIRRMEADLELKQKLAEEKLAEELEQESQSSSEVSLPGIFKKHEQDGKLSSFSKVSSKEKEEALQELKSRLDRLEKIVREMAYVDVRKTSSAEPLTKQGKQLGNGMVTSTDKGDERNLKEASKSKDAFPTNNAEAKSASRQPDKHPHSGDDSSVCSIGNQDSKNKALASEPNK